MTMPGAVSCAATPRAQIFEPQFETLDRGQLAKLQGERLRAMVARVYRDVPVYRRKLDEHGVHPTDIRGIEDLAKLPFTVKDDFRENYPFGLFARPLDEIIRVHASSGTTGKPTVVGYTRNDIRLWASTAARTLVCGGATRHDIVQVAYGYGLFTGGLGMHYGVEALGAMAVPMSGGNTKRQLALMKDFGTTYLCCTPSYALAMSEVMAEMNIKPVDLKLKGGFFGAEPWSECMRASIEQRLGIKAYDIYGLSEVIGPGVAAECVEQAGMHVFEDHFYPEVIDPVTGAPLPNGVKGELVFTCLTKEALPLIRYRTREITQLTHETCACGRTLVRMQRVSGRTDDMLIIRGVNVFPSQVESVLLNIEGASPHYQIVVERAGNLDQLEVRVEMTEQMFSDEVKRIESLRERIAREIASVLNISARVTLVEPKSIPRFEGKAQRVIDKRKCN